MILRPHIMLSVMTLMSFAFSYAPIKASSVLTLTEEEPSLELGEDLMTVPSTSIHEESLSRSRDRLKSKRRRKRRRRRTENSTYYVSNLYNKVSFQSLNDIIFSSLVEPSADDHLPSDEINEGDSIETISKVKTTNLSSTVPSMTPTVAPTLSASRMQYYCNDLLAEFSEGASDENDECDGAENFYQDVCLSNDFEWPYDFPKSPAFINYCCKQVKLIYETQCDKSDTVTDQQLAAAVSFLLVCVLVRAVIRRRNIKWMPEVGGVTIVGIIIGAIADGLADYDFASFDDALFMRVLLPPIIFDAALSVDKRRFRKHAGPILLLAFPGTLACSFMAGGIAYGLSYAFSEYCESLPFLECLIWGTLISSIDPVATIGALTDNGLNDKDLVFILIFGESLLNDGVAVVLTETLSDYLDDSITIGTEEVFECIFHFSVVLFGSLGIGVITGASATLFFWAMYGALSPLMEVLAFFFWALLPFWISDGIEWSGIVAIVATAFVLDIFVVGSLGSRGGAHHDQHGYLASTTDDSSASDAESQWTTNREHYVSHQVTYSSQLNLRTTIRSIAEGNTSLATNRFNFRRPIFSKEGLLTDTARLHIGFTIEVIASLTEMIIFLYLGMYLFSPDYSWNGYLILAAICASTLSRGIEVFLVHLIYANYLNRWLRCQCCMTDEPNESLNGPILNLDEHIFDARGRKEKSRVAPKYDINSKITVMLWIAGLRGAMSLALVENIPIYDFVSGTGTVYKPEMKAMTSGAICFTIFVFGGMTKYVLEYFGFDHRHHHYTHPRGDTHTSSGSYMNADTTLDSSTNGIGNAHNTNSSTLPTPLPRILSQSLLENAEEYSE